MIEPEKQIHPIIRGMVGFAITVLVATFIIGFIPPAWALSFPVGNLFIINLGDLPPWIGAIVAVVVYLEARSAKKKAAEAAVEAALGRTEIKAVAVQIDGLLAERDKAKVKEGQQRERIVGEEKAAILKQGQSEGRDNERASAAARSGPTTADGAPLPVADDRTAVAAERSATATERVADAAEDKKP